MVRPYGEQKTLWITVRRDVTLPWWWRHPRPTPPLPSYRHDHILPAVNTSWNLERGAKSYFTRLKFFNDRCFYWFSSSLATDKHAVVCTITFAAERSLECERHVGDSRETNAIFFIYRFWKPITIHWRIKKHHSEFV